MASHMHRTQAIIASKRSAAFVYNLFNNMYFHGVTIGLFCKHLTSSYFVTFSGKASSVCTKNKVLFQKKKIKNVEISPKIQPQQIYNT